MQTINSTDNIHNCWFSETSDLSVGVFREGGNSDGKRRKKKKRAGGMFLSWLPPCLCGRNSHRGPVGGMGAGQMGAWPALYRCKHQLSQCSPITPHTREKARLGQGWDFWVLQQHFWHGTDLGCQEGSRAFRTCSEPSGTDRAWLQPKNPNTKPASNLPLLN